MNLKLNAPLLFVLLMFSVLAISVIISGQGTSFSFGHYAEDIAGGIFGGNISSSENYSFTGRVGIDTNSPTENLDINGTVRIRNNVYIDKQSDYLFDSSGVIKEKFLPYCSEEITSDVYTNGQDQSTGCNFGGYSGYYNITSLTPSNVKSGVVFGRGETGTLAPSGTATSIDCATGKTFYSGDSWTQKTGSADCVQSSAPSASIIKSGESICGVSGTLAPSGTAVESDVRAGKTFYSGGSWVQKTGTQTQIAPGTCKYQWVGTGQYYSTTAVCGNTLTCDAAHFGITGYGGTGRYCLDCGAKMVWDSTVYDSTCYTSSDIEAAVVKCEYLCE